MSIRRLRCSNSATNMAEELSESYLRSSPAAEAAWSNSRTWWPSLLRWIPTSTDHSNAAEKRLLFLVKTPYVQEKVNIGPGPPGSRIRRFRSSRDEPRFINTVTFDGKDDSPLLVGIG